MFFKAHLTLTMVLLILKDTVAQMGKMEAAMQNQDSNNNGGDFDSEVSSVSSGYDVINGFVFEEKPESDYVYVTIDGNKLPLPKNILHPDFLANVEQTLPKSEVAEQGEEAAAFIPQNVNQTQYGTEPTLSGPTTTEQNVSVESDSSRLFIFPQNNPGFEVVYPNLERELLQVEDLFNSTIKMEGATSEPSTTYPWLHNASPENPCQAYLKCDSYKPVEQSHSTSSQSSSVAGAVGGGYTHVPNYQQSVPKPTLKTEGPPVQRQNSQSSQGCSTPPKTEPVPVHILPENFVTGAVNVASSAINTARSVINMIVPPKAEVS